MFTGIVQEIGLVRQISRSGDTKILIGCTRPPEKIEIGASIACSGVCLTVTDRGSDATGPWFAVDASAETRDRTTLGAWEVGSPVNLEPALRLGDELGGHIVSGHVDGVADIISVSPDGDSHRLEIATPAGLGRFIAEKGSVTLDGISLTVNAVTGGDQATFGVNIIPHTWAVTTLAKAGPGSRLNLEVDMLARYVARLAEVV